MFYVISIQKLSKRKVLRFTVWQFIITVYSHAIGILISCIVFRGESILLSSNYKLIHGHDSLSLPNISIILEVLFM